MKPEKGGPDMEDTLWVPADLFAEIGLLVTEARTPDLSPKGRVEGPHVLPVQGARAHVCDKHRQQCRKTDLQKKHMYMLSKNMIPMRIDVFLMPNCDHGQLEACTVVGPITASQEDMTLLERWDVQILSKRLERCDATFVTGRVLLQAIRSYLHFSQLSSWLTSQRGHLPVQVVYRIYAPGESVCHGFTSLPEKHHFPIADLSHAAIRAEVSSIPRQQTIPIFLCMEEDATTGITRKRKSPVQPDDICSREVTPFTEPNEKKQNLPVKKPFPARLVQGYDKDTTCVQTSSNRSLQEVPDKSKSVWKQRDQPQSSGSSSSLNPTSTSQKDDVQGKSFWSNCSISYETQYESRKPPKCQPSKRTKNVGYFSVVDFNEPQGSRCKQQPNSDQNLDSVQSCSRLNHEYDEPKIDITDKISAMKQTFKGNPLNLSDHRHEVAYTKGHEPSVLIKRLPSPKVLLTSTGNTKGSSVFFKRRKIDLGAPGDEYDTFTEDRILSDAISDSVKPLKSEDIEAYLSSLSHHAPISEKTSTTLDNIPLTKCRFYIGEDARKKTDIPHCESEGNMALDRNQCKLDSDSKPTVVRHLFKKSLSEPGPSLCQLEACEISFKKSEKDHSEPVFSQKFSVPQNIEDFSENGCSDDSTPTNSLSDSTEVLTSNRASSHLPPTTSTGVSIKRSPPSYSDVWSASFDHGLSNAKKIQKGEVTHEVKHAVPVHKSRDDSCFELEKGFSGLNIKCDSSLSGSTLNCDWARTSNPSCDLPIVDDKELPVNGETTKSDNICDRNNLTKSRKAGGTTLCKHILNKELKRNLHNEETRTQCLQMEKPQQADIFEFRQTLDRSSAMVFNTSTGLPSRSSPAPVKRKSTGRFDYDNTLINARAIKNALSCSKLVLQSESTGVADDNSSKVLSTSAPASTNCLLGNFEESVLNGRIEPVGVVSGFTAEIGAGGCFCPKHVTIPVTAYFFQLSDDNAPSPYLGHINLDCIGKRGYHIPKCGTLQVTLFNPNKTVVKMFVVMYDLSDMPPNCQTFLRQRTLYTPVDSNSTEPSYLRYLIHLRISSTKTGKIFLHTDIRLIFARDKFEFDPRVANYELRSYTEGPQNPKFSPKR
ncbi:atos homolog protein A-like isoform X2 [Ylistrum balloti]|uniref:atos homolog protein A-like isoform X2 n=1 Tax=Ylistrum balloti TaxID=509963 RepID=UPI002905C4B2|nr:atos homolog protein A-like isoform X2 [Ylistrum balloti]